MSEKQKKTTIQKKLDWDSHHEIYSVVEWAVGVRAGEDLDVFISQQSGVTFFFQQLWEHAMKRLVKLFREVVVTIDAMHVMLKVELDYPYWNEIEKRYRLLEKKWEEEENEE